ncbi:AMP-binding protein [Bradyrhizobium arachidis]|uniref:AMP-binding protein n=1 Tax=Bradyrhizobium arachidis TaxID=858423 RepID=UPI0021619C87|nr:AMP-binding protein [Bradyrhizobium arachidis]UVO30474.1 AMP-binding protein [Bradyrhizobium arachidis]
MLTLHELIQKQAQEQPEKVFLRFDRESIDFRELQVRVSSASRVLRELGIKPENRVAVMMANHVEHVIIYLALAWIGAISVEFSTHLKRGGIQLQLNDAEPQFFIVDSQFLGQASAALEEIRFVNPKVLVRGAEGANLKPPFVPLAIPVTASIGEPFPATLDRVHTIGYTSGTTGGPKGVLMTERYFQVGAKNAAVLADVRSDDVLFVWEPFYHIAGWMSVTMALQHGASVALVERFSGSKCWDQIRQSGATILHYLGGAMNILLKQPRRPDDRENSIRVAWGGGAPRQNWRLFEDRFGVAVREGYGLSEAQNFTHLNLEGRVGSIGKPAEEFESWIAGENGERLPNGTVGEIVVRPKVSRIVMQGYFQAPKLTSEVLRDGCVYTGDLGYQDDDGFFYYSGRKKDSLRRRGENVSAWEVERVINAHPAVEESAIVGVSSEMGEQDIRAFVKLVAGTVPDPVDLLQWCQRELAYYQVPRYFDFVEEFPRGPTQRIRKNDLSKDLSTSWDVEKSNEKNGGLKTYEARPVPLQGASNTEANEIQTELQGGVLVLRLNRPEQLNAWTSGMRDTLCEVLDRAATDKQVRALIFTGTGSRAFCAGQDFAETERFARDAHTKNWLQRLKRFYDAVRGMPKPMVAALNGLAAGSGFQITMLMDIVVAHRGVQMGQPEVNSGIPSILGPCLMKESLGRSRTAELAVTGRMMDANECHRLGLIHHLVEEKSVLPFAVSLALDLASKPPEAFRITKEYLCRANAAEYDRAWVLASEGQIEAFNTGEPQAAMRDFFAVRRARKGHV